MSKEDLSNEFDADFPSVVQLSIPPTHVEELASCVHTVSQVPDSESHQAFRYRNSSTQWKERQESSKTSTFYYVRELVLSFWPKLPPLMTGIGAGIATSNALGISLGLYTLLHGTTPNSGPDVLARATQQYKAGNLDKAIALASSIPINSPAYQESLIAMQEWRQEWNFAAAQYQAIEEAFNEGRWRDVLEEARKTPNIAVWQQKIEPFVEQAKPELEVQAQQLLQQAYQRAALQDFGSALDLIEQISPDTPTGAKIQPKLAEYSQKQQIKAESLLQQAYQRASQRDFRGALQYLSQIPENTPTSEIAQLKMAEYSQKQDFQEEVERRIALSANLPKEESEFAKPPQPSDFWKASKNLNPGNQLKETSPKPIKQAKPKSVKQVMPQSVPTTPGEQ